MRRLVFTAASVFLLSAGAARAQCAGASGVPFNCADGGAVVAGSIFQGGNVSTGKSVKHTAAQIATYVRSGVTVTTVTDSAALAATDRHVCVNHSAPATITLMPSPATGAVPTVADCSGGAAANTITVQPAAGTVMGTTSVAMAQAYMSLDFVYTGTGWVLQ